MSMAMALQLAPGHAEAVPLFLQALARKVDDAGARGVVPERVREGAEDAATLAERLWRSPLNGGYEPTPDARRRSL